MIFKLGLLIVLMMAFWGSTVSHYVSHDEMKNMTNNMYANLENNTFKEQGNNPNMTFLERAIGKYGDLIFFIGATAFKESANYGYEHPNEAYKYVMWFVFLSLMAPLIIPLIYVIGLLYYCGVWIYDYLKKSDFYEKRITAFR